MTAHKEYLILEKVFLQKIERNHPVKMTDDQIHNEFNKNLLQTKVWMKAQLITAFNELDRFLFKAVNNMKTMKNKNICFNIMLSMRLKKMIS